MNDAVLPQRAMHLTYGTWGPDAAGTAAMCVRETMLAFVRMARRKHHVCAMHVYVHAYGICVANNTTMQRVSTEAEPLTRWGRWRGVARRGLPVRAMQ